MEPDTSVNKKIKLTPPDKAQKTAKVQQRKAEQKYQETEKLLVQTFASFCRDFYRPNQSSCETTSDDQLLVNSDSYFQPIAPAEQDTSKNPVLTVDLSYLISHFRQMLRLFSHIPPYDKIPESEIISIKEEDNYQKTAKILAKKINAETYDNTPGIGIARQALSKNTRTRSADPFRINHLRRSPRTAASTSTITTQQSANNDPRRTDIKTKNTEHLTLL